MKISVVMACYADDSLRTLTEAVESVLCQTAPPHEFIIVVDGPVPPMVTQYLNNLSAKRPVVKVIKSPRNSGAGPARNLGMAAATGEFIAIMDADDVLYPDRLSTQLDALITQGVDAVWGWQEEFDDETGAPMGLKRSAEHHDEIIEQLKFRNLLPDPTTLLRRECFEVTGGYGTYSIGMDHQFFVAMALAGFRFYCVQRPLVRVRVSPAQRQRRGGIRLFRQDVMLRNWMLRSGFITRTQYVKALVAYAIFRSLPNGVRHLVYRHALRA